MFRKWSFILLQADDNQSVSWYVSRWWLFRKVASCRWVGVLVVGRLVDSGFNQNQLEIVLIALLFHLSVLSSF